MQTPPTDEHLDPDTRILAVLCGVILMGMIGYISLWAIDAVNATSTGQIQFTGTQQEKLMIFSRSRRSFSSVAVR